MQRNATQGSRVEMRTFTGSVVAWRNDHEDDDIVVLDIEDGKNLFQAYFNMRMMSEARQLNQLCNWHKKFNNSPLSFKLNQLIGESVQVEVDMDYKTKQTVVRLFPCKS